MSSDPTVPPKIKKAPKITKKETPETEPEVDPVEKYQGITLNFGKHAGRQLKDVAADDPKYLKWLRQRFEKDENATPTMLAIAKYANAVA